MAMLHPAETGIQPPTSNKTKNKTDRTLDAEESKLLTRQGEQFAEAGDLVTARVLFQRVAETGDARAATALGATYDPTVLAKLRVVGIGADVEQARFWYQRPRALAHRTRNDGSTSLRIVSRMAARQSPSSRRRIFAALDRGSFLNNGTLQKTLWLKSVGADEEYEV
jgi:TPR repeat protein